ncbi:MAG: ABC transporter ATP-binding protein [Phycisphaerales bacterium]
MSHARSSTTSPPTPPPTPAHLADAREGAPPRGTDVLLAARALHKTYRLGRVDVPVLRGVDLDVRRGEWLAILGASGSGKSTLLHLLGGLDRPDSAGRHAGHPVSAIEFEGRSIQALSRSALDRYRNQSVGFVFQFYHLLPELTVVENVTLAAMVRFGLGTFARRDSLRAEALAILEALGLGHRLLHRPIELSGGERQRVAIARALINRPPVLLADEPTGNLDHATGEKILDMLSRIRAERGLTVVMVTHDREVAARADRIVHLVDGRVAPA